MKIKPLAVVEKVGLNKNHESVYELRQWKGSKIYARGTMHHVFDAAEKEWPRHVRTSRKIRNGYLILPQQKDEVTELITAMEWGFRAREKGLNLERATAEFLKLFFGN